MNKKWFLGLWMILGAGVIFMCASNSMAQTPDHEFVGVSKCSMCHKSEKMGQQAVIWQGSSHAKAFDTLGTAQAKDVGKKFGVDNPQASGKCLKCHSTAYGFSENKVTDKVTVEEGVSCESCHGAGKDYMKMSIMKDKQQSIDGGLKVPDEKTCAKCHNSESPTAKTFDFKTMWEKIKHPMPKG
ncbi:MAG: cytochrome c family protein [Candidatus Omnitrophica bacterium]|nr:cytochrome c family protein [Candidatus Omnitrophota bacterium]